MALTKEQKKEARKQMEGIMGKHRELDNLVDQYVNLARKLGKFPSAKEVKRFICSADKFARITNANDIKAYNGLKAYVMEKYPQLEYLEIPVKITSKDIEAYKFDVEKKKNKKHNDNTIKRVTGLDYLEEFVDRICTKQITPHKIPKAKKKMSRALNLTFSDLHFGADIKREETGHLNYGSVEEARRLAEIVKQTVEYKPQYRKDTALYVNLLGDIIQHKLHDLQDAACVSEQQARAIHLLAQALAHLAEHFPKVYVKCGVGNHGRDTGRHKSRATSGKWDSVEIVIYYALKKILAKYTNIEFEIPKTPFLIYEVLGHKVFTTHGDTVLAPGNPGKSLNVGALENQINKVNASLKDDDEVKVVIVGHTHCASISQISNGVTVVTNGCLPPVDQFAVSIGILEGRSSQTLFEMTEKHAVGDIRILRVGKDQDSDASLDKIISPFIGFND